MVRMKDTLRIEGLMVDCVVGVYPHERDAPQPLRVDIDMHFDMSKAATESLRDTVDYAALSAQVIFLLRSARFRLLETATIAIAKLILAPPCPAEERTQVDEVCVRVTKPGALRGFAIPSIEMTRDADWANRERVVRSQENGETEVLHETRHVGVYRVHLAAGAATALPVHRPMRGTEFVLTDGLSVHGAKLKVGAVQRWPKEATRSYQNVVDHTASLLCVDAPGGPLS